MKKKNVNVCIVGGGKIGCELAMQLADNNCEVTVIEQNLSVVNKISNSADVICYQGNGAVQTVLADAGVENADIFIAVTGSDELNMLSCLTANAMGAKNTIARMRNAQYSISSAFYTENFGLSMIVNPDFVAANEIQRILHLPLATKTELFGKGKCEIVELKVEEDNIIVDKTLIDINKKLNMNILICAIVRDNHIIIPNGADSVKAGDVLYSTGTPKNIAVAFKKMSAASKNIKNVLIAGASRIGYYLAKMLSEDGISVTLVERDHDRAMDVASEIQGIDVMCADAMEYFDSLSDADVENIDAYIALTNSDEYNMVAALMAEKNGVYKVVTKMNNRSTLKTLSNNSRIADVSKESVASDIIVGYARSIMEADEYSEIESMYSLMDGKLEFVQFRVKNAEFYVGKKLKDLNIKKGCIVAGIIRGRKSIMPRGFDEILVGDLVIICSAGKTILSLDEIFD